MNKLAKLILIGLALISCGHPKSGHKPYRVEVKAFDFAFQAPDTLPSGWITFVLNNETGHQVHELSLARIPKGISYQTYLANFNGGWATILKELQDGKISRSDIHERAGQLLPKWADSVAYITARGLVSPGRSAEKTLYLRPGSYALECWVKTSDGIIHLRKGMTKLLTITDDPANSPKPTPDSFITVYKDSIETSWNASLGKHTFALNIKTDGNGNAVHNDIHLIKLEESTDLKEVNRWLDWYHVGGLRNPAPAEFLGGTSTYYSKAGDQTFFSLTIAKPGDYAWIVQTPEGEELWKKFSIE